MRGLTAVELDLLRGAGGSRPRFLVEMYVGHESLRIAQEMVECGRLSFCPRGDGSYESRLTEAGRLALRLWPLVRQHFEAGPSVQ